jgi:N-hydroxyarylamine O-acetyltransferase
MPLDIDIYLDRIGASEARKPSAENLAHLHRSHLLAVPFENLDMHLVEKKAIVLDEDAFFDKIVTRRRGGYCYELNGLFAALLRALGYDVTLLSGRAKISVGNFGPEFDHLTLLVRLDESWVVDVGFGDGFLTPLRLDDAGPQNDGLHDYRLDVRQKDHRLLLRRDERGEWWEQYLFNLVPRELTDFAEMNHHHQTSLSSHFTRGMVATRATPRGRVTVSNRRLIRTDGDRQTLEALATDGEVLAALQRELDLDPAKVGELRIPGA